MTCEDCKYFGGPCGDKYMYGRYRCALGNFGFNYLSVTCCKFERKTMNKKELYKQMQALWVEENNVKVGDTVRVLRAPQQNELGADCSDWHEKAAMVGLEFKVEGIDSVCIRLCFRQIPSLYPFFCLEKIKSVEVKRNIELRYFCGGKDLTNELSNESKKKARDV